jgi:hypothetical protein
VTDDQFRYIKVQLRLISCALAIIVGLLAGFLWLLPRDGGGPCMVPDRVAAGLL